MSHVLYRFYSATGQLLYIGITANPPARFGQHRSDKDWWSEVSDIKIETHENRNALRAAEATAIRAEKPRYNKVHNGSAATTATSVSSPVVESPLIGKRFHTRTKCVHDILVAEWQGWIVATPSSEVLLIELYSFSSGQPNGQQLITIPDFTTKNPVLYESDDDLRFHYEYGDLAHSGVCHQLPDDWGHVDVTELFPGLFGRSRRETRFGLVTDEEYERRAAEYGAKLDARDACHLCDHDGYRPNMRVCNHIDYGDGSPYQEALKRQLQVIQGGDA